MRWLVCACSLAIGSGIAAGQTVSPVLDSAAPVALSGIAKNVLTNQGVAMLARSGYSECFIIDMIFNKQTQFDVSADGLVWLARQGLSERVIRVMVANDRKEEFMALLPGPIGVASQNPGAQPVTPVRAVLRGKGKHDRDIAIEVVMPTLSPNPASRYVSAWDRDRWFVAPNVPVLAVNAR